MHGLNWHIKTIGLPTLSRPKMSHYKPLQPSNIHIRLLHRDDSWVVMKRVSNMIALPNHHFNHVKYLSCVRIWTQQSFSSFFNIFKYNCQIIYIIWKKVYIYVSSNYYPIIYALSKLLIVSMSLLNYQKISICHQKPA